MALPSEVYICSQPSTSPKACCASRPKLGTIEPYHKLITQYRDYEFKLVYSKLDLKRIDIGKYGQCRPRWLLVVSSPRGIKCALVRASVGASPVSSSISQSDSHQYRSTNNAILNLHKTMGTTHRLKRALAVAASRPTNPTSSS